MKPNPDNQLRKRIADALLADDPIGFSDREIERALEEVRRSGEAANLTDIEMGRILLKMRQKLQVGRADPRCRITGSYTTTSERKEGGFRR